MNQKTGIFLAFLLLSFSASAQRYFQEVYKDLQDTIYYPEIERYLNQQQFDSAVFVGQEALDFYMEKENPDKALFHFNAGMYLPTGKGLRQLTHPKLINTLTLMRNEIDTLNPHFAITHQILAFSYKFEERMPEAIRHYHITEEIYRQLKIKGVQLAGVYESLGSAYVHINNPIKGYEYLNKALSGFEKKNMPHEESHIYLEMARATGMNNQTLLALEFNKKALEIIRKNNPQGFNHVVVPSNMANVYLNLEKYDKTIEMARYADSVMRHYHSPDNLYYLYFSILANQGIAYRSMEKYGQAEKYFRELITQLKKYLGEAHPMVGNGWSELARNFADQQHYDSALACYRKMARLQPPSPALYGDLAMVFARMHQPDSSIRYHRMALNMLSGKELSSEKVPTTRQLQHPMYGFELSEGMMRQLFEKEDEDSFRKALAFAGLADSLVTIINETTLIGRSDAALGGAYHRFATSLIGQLISNYKKNPDKEILEELVHFMSRSKTIKLMGQLNQIGVVKDSTSNPLQYQQVQLMTEIRKLENELMAIGQENEDDESYQKLDQQLFEKRIEAFENSARLKNEASLDNLSLGPETTQLSDIQEALNDEVLISYHLSDKAYAMAVSPKEVMVSEIDMGKEPSSFIRNYFRAIKTGGALDEIGAKMYRKLLGPFEELLAQYNSLVIIPDGLLHQVPFEALNSGDSFLTESHAISYQYSIPLWIKSVKTHVPANELFAFAPVYDDNQILAENSPLRYDSVVYRDFSELRSGESLAPLTYSETEVNEVVRMFHESGKKSKAFLRDEALESTFKKEVSNAGILHVATHGYSSRKDPELSGLFFYDETSQDATNDGMLYSGEIFGLDLNADLVVLSACKTGYGKIVEGEGVMALPRGFIFSGAKNVMASLWKVSDKETQKLLTAFYEHVLDGNSYKKALQKARIQMIEDGVLPVDWAGFVLVGR